MVSPPDLVSILFIGGVIGPLNMMSIRESVCGMAAILFETLTDAWLTAVGIILIIL